LTACGRFINSAKTGITRASESSRGFFMLAHRRFKQQLAGRNRKTAKALVGHKALYDLLTIIQQTGQETDR